MDTLKTALRIECCWVQLISVGSKRLKLAAARGFTPDMTREMAAMDLSHPFTREVISVGNNISIPNLSRGGSYHISTFTRAGYRSLMAVPIMTYKVHGIMGVAFRSRKRFDKDYTEMLTVIANLIGMALNKSRLSRQDRNRQEPTGTVDPPFPESSPESAEPASRWSAEVEPVSNNSQLYHNKTGKDGKPFHEHAHQMRVFRKNHKAL